MIEALFFSFGIDDKKQLNLSIEIEMIPRPACMREREEVQRQNSSKREIKVRNSLHPSSMLNNPNAFLRVERRVHTTQYF